MTTSHHRVLPVKSTLFFIVMIIYCSAFGVSDPHNANGQSDQITGQFLNSGKEELAWDNLSKNQLFSLFRNVYSRKSDFAGNMVSNQSFSVEASSFQIQALPFFPKIYIGNGVDHMNINLVNLNQTGLLVGDEIGVFDGIYCVGSLVIGVKNMTDNNISIPASANDTIESQPNGYIDGHKIALKCYRSGIVYQLYFQTVNSTQDIFERGGSMFALVDFSQSTGQVSQNQVETIRMYPNPFDNQLIIELILPQQLLLEIRIFDQSGNLIRTLFNGLSSGHVILNWDGKDNNQSQVASGTYYCKVNDNITKIIYKRSDLH